MVASLFQIHRCGSALCQMLDSLSSQGSFFGVKFLFACYCSLWKLCMHGSILSCTVFLT